jgi:segregation and condensation protein A
MASSLAHQAIAHLIDLAEQGEIDPWNVQVIEVMDRFLSMLAQLEAQNAREIKLSQSGQAFLYASMLILLKADSLVRMGALEAVEDLSECVEELDLSLDPSQKPLPPALERRLRRRATAQPLQTRSVTLSELIDQLRRVASSLESDQSRRLRVRRPRPQSRTQAIRTITQLAHQENLSEIADGVARILTQRVRQGEWVEFEQLLSWHTRDTATSVDPDCHAHSELSARAGVFWSLLYLSAQSKVELEQATFYQDLKVRLPINGLQLELDTAIATVEPES